MVEKDKIAKHNGQLLVYVLDLSDEKKKIISEVSNELGLTVTSTMPESSFKEAGSKNVEKCIFPPVTNWIRGFMDAEFVITDSFHGTVFSIIFNKPFIAVGNKKRGMTRFISLLKMFNLENRLIEKADENLKAILNDKIDFAGINEILETKKTEAVTYLENALKSAELKQN
jgi:exopolysaccharide biosynthesis predicted pyruvyltransferase EpsI